VVKIPNPVYTLREPLWLSQNASNTSVVDWVFKVSLILYHLAQLEEMRRMSYLRPNSKIIGGVADN